MFEAGRMIQAFKAIVPRGTFYVYGGVHKRFFQFTFPNLSL
jgi:hypothetical protein